MLACSQLVDIVPAPTPSSSRPPRSWTRPGTTRYWSATSSIGSAGSHYPMPENERFLFDADPHGLALVHQDHRAAAGGGDLRGLPVPDDAGVRRRPAAGRGVRRILQDESRHMGFGMLALPGVVKEASAAGAARRWRTSPALALEKVLTGFFPIDAYRDMGFSPGADRRGPDLPAGRGGAKRLRACSGSTSSATCTPPWSRTSRGSASSPSGCGRGWPRWASRCPPSSPAAPADASRGRRRRRRAPPHGPQAVQGVPERAPAAAGRSPGPPPTCPPARRGGPPRAPPGIDGDAPSARRARGPARPRTDRAGPTRGRPRATGWAPRSHAQRRKSSTAPAASAGGGTSQRRRARGGLTRSR